MPVDKERKVYNTAVIVGVILLLVFAFTGQEIFILFGISIESFEIAGGILLLIIAIRMLITGGLHETSETAPESIGAVPIAMPLLVGPGAITTTILNLQTSGIAIAVLSVLIVLLITWVILRFIDKIYRYLGKTGAMIIARVMSLLIAAIAVQYIVNGVTAIIGSM